MPKTVAAIAASALLAITIPALAGGTPGASPGATAEPYRADIEGCDIYARAQIDHDARIERDMGAAFDSSDAGLGLTALRGRMRTFEQSHRRPRLFIDCMKAKGHVGSQPG
ncbi:MAG: hypothetical protein ACE5KF_09405 [Kiloniellaceae bacterium]